MLFAIEVTSSVFHTSDYWKSFFCAVVGEMVFRELSYFGTARSSQISLFPTTFRSQPYLLSELPVFLILSAICGLYGGFYVKWIIGVRTWRQQRLSKAEQWHAKMAQPGGFESAMELELENRFSGNLTSANDDEEMGVSETTSSLHGAFNLRDDGGGGGRKPSSVPTTITRGGRRRFDVCGIVGRYDAFVERRDVRIGLFYLKHFGMKAAR